MLMRKALVLVVVLALALGGCTGMNATEQRVLGGTAIGASSGALIGAAAGSPAVGAAIGASAGLVGGLIYDQYQRSRGQ
jgi:osmotically inducible lipoprotein OsmB